MYSFEVAILDKLPDLLDGGDFHFDGVLDSDASLGVFHDEELVGAGRFLEEVSELLVVDFEVGHADFEYVFLREEGVDRFLDDSGLVLVLVASGISLNEYGTASRTWCSFSLLRSGHRRRWSSCSPAGCTLRAWF